MSVIIKTESQKIILRHLLSGVPVKAIHAISGLINVSIEEVDKAMEELFRDGFIVKTTLNSITYYKLSSNVEISLHCKDDLK